MSKELINFLRENDLNYQQLNNFDDEELVLVNCNLLYYVASFYARKLSKYKRDEQVIECLTIINQNLECFEGLNSSSHSINEINDSQLFHPLSVKDAKMIFKPWAHTNQICGRPFAILKNTDENKDLLSSELPVLKKNTKSKENKLKTK